MDLQHAAGLRVGTSKGRKRNRKFLRSHTVVEREHRALEMLVKGMPQRDIARELAMSESGVSVLIKRALKLRADAMSETAEQARALLGARYEKLLERWWPMATGDYVDPTSEDGQGVPNIRALEGVLKIMAALGDITGATRPAAPGGPAPSFTGGVHVHTTQPGELDELKAGILAALAATRQKGEVIQGHLVEAQTSLERLDGSVPDDTPGPPPRRTDEAA